MVVPETKVLFWYEDHVVGEIYATIDRWCAYFGVAPLPIDKVGQFAKQGPGRLPAAQSLEEAMEMYPDHRWVFMDPGGDVYLDEFEHSSEPTVYALGSDFDGFGDADLEKLPGKVVKLRNPDSTFAHMVVPLVLYSRELALR